MVEGTSTNVTTANVATPYVFVVPVSHDVNIYSMTWESADGLSTAPDAIFSLKAAFDCGFVENNDILEVQRGMCNKEILRCA